MDIKKLSGAAVKVRTGWTKCCVMHDKAAIAACPTYGLHITVNPSQGERRGQSGYETTLQVSIDGFKG